MRFEKFRYLMDKAFVFNAGQMSFVCDKPLLREMKRVWDKWSKEEDDYRDGYETYEYKTRESINNNLHYVSDRWRCAFRLKWLIDGVEGGHFK